MGLVKWDPNVKVGFTFPKWRTWACTFRRAWPTRSTSSSTPSGSVPSGRRHRQGHRCLPLLRPGPVAPVHRPHRLRRDLPAGPALLDPRMPLMIGDALRWSRRPDTAPRSVRGPPSSVPSRFSTATMGFQAASQAGGHQLGNMLVQQELTASGNWWQDRQRRSGPRRWRNSTTSFTNYVSLGAAGSRLPGRPRQGCGQAKKWHRFREPAWHMTAERAKFEGIQHALNVMGDLKAMTPFERAVMTRIMPFYGWTRHILPTSLTYPGRPPLPRPVPGRTWPTRTATRCAKRPRQAHQFLFFLGSPDAQGNVSAVDTRFLDPLRDMANYASLGGLDLGAEPAIISAPLAMMGPAARLRVDQPLPERQLRPVLRDRNRRHPGQRPSTAWSSSSPRSPPSTPP